MKWDVYNLMNEKQKEEYNFKFTRNKPNFQSYIFIYFIFKFEMIMTLFTIFLIVTNEKLSHLIPKIWVLIESISIYSMVGVWLIFGLALSQLIGMIYFKYSEWKFLKANRINVKFRKVF